MTSGFKHKGGGDHSYCWRNHFHRAPLPGSVQLGSPHHPNSGCCVPQPLAAPAERVRREGPRACRTASAQSKARGRSARQRKLHFKWLDPAWEGMCVTRRFPHPRGQHQRISHFPPPTLVPFVRVRCCESLPLRGASCSPQESHCSAANLWSPPDPHTSPQLVLGLVNPKERCPERERGKKELPTSRGVLQRLRITFSVQRNPQQ